MWKSEKGASLVLWAFFLVFVFLPMLALAVDGGLLFVSRVGRQKIVDAACLDGAIASQNGQDPTAAVIANLERHGVPPDFYNSQEGTGITLHKGVEVSAGYIRVGIWGPAPSFFARFVGNPLGWTMGARAHCQRGVGGILPLALKEWEWRDDDGDDISDWVWGDEVVLAGNGHWPNFSTGQDMSGLIAADIRCLNSPCTQIWFVPPIPDGTQQNVIKDVTMSYILSGGYSGPLPVVGENVGQQAGVSNHKLVQAIDFRFDPGDVIAHFVYKDGQVFDGEQNFDYVNIVGYVFSRFTRMDANTAWVVPLTGILTYNELLNHADFSFKPVLIPWTEGG